MHNFHRTIASTFLLLATAPALRAQDSAVHLTVDQSTQSLHLRSLKAGTLFLVLGPALTPPFQFAGIELDVGVHFLLPLGTVDPGDQRQFFVPRSLSELSAEAILADAEFQLHDSLPVRLVDSFADIVAATFRATLIATDSIPPIYSVGASLTAPSEGHVFQVDGVQRSEEITHVYLRLIAPGENELVPLVLTEHQTAVTLGSDIGRAVNVYLMRTQRGSVGPEVYRLMATLIPDEK